MQLMTLSRNTSVIVSIVYLPQVGACVAINTWTQAIRIFLRSAKTAKVVHWQEYIMRGVEAEAVGPELKVRSV
ncbi:hypothetical protein ASPTUDRAFT_40423, partial [Aspergillus tubingensis CBS 134.48]